VIRTPLRAALAVLALVALAACAEPPTDDGDTGAPRSAPVDLPPAGSLVLLVEQTGGFTSPDAAASRLPLVALYSDGRAYAQGPVALIHPGPALPNVQVTTVPVETVQQLAEQAMAAGVAATGDLGTPPVADAPSTRFTLVTAEETHVREVYALTESVGTADGSTAEQREGRAALLELLDALTATPDAAAEAHLPATLAVVTRPWSDGDADPELPQPDATWPGPASPWRPPSDSPAWRSPAPTSAPCWRPRPRRTRVPRGWPRTAPAGR
jgi:hypothetical protein